MEMTLLEIILGIVVIAVAAVLVALVLLQSGKDKKLSGAIAGGADTFFAKGKSQTKDKILARITTVLAFTFGILSVVLYVMLAK